MTSSVTRYVVQGHAGFGRWEDLAIRPFQSESVAFDCAKICTTQKWASHFNAFRVVEVVESRKVLKPVMQAVPREAAPTTRTES